ncbi:hypothetical protein [Streptomyces lincolnensis]|uniref:hypothetical protein n=1 Tax=Streptomyces lincolnensis TaxID=1915 RepID=UPI0013520A6C|nr:hypothetical protein [Streptomyces lincolnensis]QMV11684.1 hypothetical protein GJU35_42435 [Streptomyces lincolnensis]
MTHFRSHPLSKVEHQNATVLSDDGLRTLDARWRVPDYLVAGRQGSAPLFKQGGSRAP